MSEIETIVRRHLAEAAGKDAAGAAALPLDADLVYDLGLTSLDLIVLMSTVCESAGVPLTEFTEDDLAALRGARDIVGLLSSKAVT
ncbi:phosphopantetheine-binding protein [Burkholderia glumae]